MLNVRCLLASGAMLGALTAHCSAASPQNTLLYQFMAGQRTGYEPFGSLTSDTAGNLYGVTLENRHGGYGGTVFKLERPLAGNTWTLSTLHSFTGHAGGGYPAGGLLSTSNALYGATSTGGQQYGVIYKLTPPATVGGKWIDTTLYTFAGGPSGGSPSGALIKDATGALIGVARTGGRYGPPCYGRNCGVVYRLRLHRDGPATYTVLHEFQNGPDGAEPMGSVASDAAGALYGTTYSGGAGCGTVYKLTPPPLGQAKWSYEIIYTLPCTTAASPLAGPSLDAAGNVYVTAYGGGVHNQGVVFRLSPPAEGGSQWTYNNLFSFTGKGMGAGPDSPVLIDARGNLYGTTDNGSTDRFGVVYELTPPSSGAGPYTETLLSAFTVLGYNSSGGLFADPSGDLFDTATLSQSAECPTCAGAVYEITGSGFATSPASSHPQ